MKAKGVSPKAVTGMKMDIVLSIQFSAFVLLLKREITRHAMSIADISVCCEIDHSGTYPGFKQAYRSFNQFIQAEFKYQ